MHPIKHLRGWLHELRSRLWNRVGPVSLVLLLRNPIFFDTERLSASIQYFDAMSSIEGTTDNFVTSSGETAIVYLKPHMISLLNSDKPYFNVDPNEYAKLFPQASQQQGWSEHRAWTSLDYLRGGRDVEMEYRVLAQLAALILDQNCSGLYIPQEKSFVPNDSSLMNALMVLSGNKNKQQ